MKQDKDSCLEDRYFCNSTYSVDVDSSETNHVQRTGVPPSRPGSATSESFCASRLPIADDV
jgi:hypothetical protein